MLSWPAIIRLQETSKMSKYETYGDSLIAAAKLYIDSYEEDVFYYEGGIKQYVEYLNRTRTPIHRDIIYFEVTENNREVEIAIQYTDSYSENIASYANNIKTTEGGFHLQGGPMGTGRLSPVQLLVAQLSHHELSVHLVGALYGKLH